MDRFRWQKFGFLGASLSLAAALAVAGGCSLLPTAMYVFQGINSPADFDGLKGKRVAIVCRPITSLHFKDSSVSRDLAKQVGNMLEKNVRKIQIVDQRDVFEWADENNWDEYVEIGKAVNADMVIGIDLEEFNLHQGQTLFQGRANMRIFVYDVNNGRDPVFDQNLGQKIYPPTAAIPTSDMPEAQFRRQFVNYLAHLTARYFYDHDSTIDFASDPTALHD